ncbi:hypothetical protein [uncultured Paludibaculum sp.]|uniref:hypothetical protein n=1 Tax=uncultured Paludibaculum sp. TaxID=1765020 RepID=UPI002AAB85E6|nr:hypothetical protein [uncultured Paludibaculum sp.]
MELRARYSHIRTKVKAEALERVVERRGTEKEERLAKEAKDINALPAGEPTGTVLVQ